MASSVDYDVIIAGLGAMGCATALQLTKRGQRVLGLDRFSIPNTLSSHHGHSRVIRQAYFEHPDYVPLLLRAYELWRELQAESGETLLTITGGLYIGRSGSEMLAGMASTMRVHQLPHQSVGPRELAERFPQFRLPEDATGLFEQNAGVLYPERCIAVQARLARQHGAELHENEPVIDWSSNSDGAVIETRLGKYSARKLVLCPGAWANDLLKDVGVEIVPTRQVVGWAAATGAPEMQPGHFPVWLADLEDGLYYGLPELKGRGIKLAQHVSGVPVDPHEMDREPAPEDAAPLEMFVSQHLPRAAGPLAEVGVCIYENSPDGHFIIDQHPRYEHCVLARGFSGHGFKFAPVVGEVLADLALTGRSKLPVGFLSLARFAG